MPLPPAILATRGSGATVVREFRYDFKLPGLRVKMWHVKDSEGRLSLVEVVEGGPRLVALWLAIGAGVVSYVVGGKKK